MAADSRTMSPQAQLDTFFIMSVPLQAETTLLEGNSTCVPASQLQMGWMT
jgi:hypothetical protein